MKELLDSFSFWGELAVAAVIVAVVVSIAEHRRDNRSDIDKVGFMPWTTITMLAILTALISAALAFKGV